MNFAAPLYFIRFVIMRDWQSLGVTLGACAVAAVVTCFQYQVYTSFVRAGAAAPRLIGGDVWVSAASIECFDFPAYFSEDYAGQLSRYFPDARMRRVAFGFTEWRSPTGKRGNVAIIGIDDANLADDTFIAEQSDLKRLNLTGAAGELATVGTDTLALASTTDRLPTFLGAPYLIVSFARARSILGTDTASTAFLVLDGVGGAALRPAVAAASAGLPELAIRSAPDFAASSSGYWRGKTGAGSAILLAAILASLLMVILLVNGVLRFIQRYHQDLVSMLGHGADRNDIAVAATGIAVIVAAATLFCVFTVTPLMIELAKPLLPWTTFTLGDALLPAAAVFAALAMAIGAARRAVLAYGHEAVFRS